jgi:DNA-binding XRE family transcriptional regulator
MPPKERSIDRGTRRGTAIVVELGRELRLARLQHGLSQEALGHAIGMSDTQVGRIERGQVPGASVVCLTRFAERGRARALGTRVSDRRSAARQGATGIAQPSPRTGCGHLHVADGSPSRRSRRPSGLGRGTQSRRGSTGHRGGDPADRSSGRTAAHHTEVSRQRGRPGRPPACRHPHEPRHDSNVRDVDSERVSNPRTRCAAGAARGSTIQRECPDPGLRSPHSLGWSGLRQTNTNDEVADRACRISASDAGTRRGRVGFGRFSAGEAGKRRRAELVSSFTFV